jgi:hypothetical protein
MPGWVLGVELGWATERESSDALMGGMLSTDLYTHAVHGGVQLRYTPHDWIEPQLRLVGGGEFWKAHLRFRKIPRVEHVEVAPFGAATLGVLLRTPAGQLGKELGSASLGVLVEGGYALVAPYEMPLEVDDGESAIPVDRPDLGDLDRSGPLLRISAVLRI